MSKLLFSGLFFLLIALGSSASIQCQTSQVFKDLHEAIIKKEQRAEELARMINVGCIDVSYSIDGHSLGQSYWNNWDANTDRSYTTTIINLALFYDQINVVMILIERGANLLLKDTNGNTALHIASCRGHKTVVTMILNKLEPQAINLRNNAGATALHMAAAYYREDVIKELLKNLANPFITDNYENTALHLAIDNYRYFGQICTSAELIVMIIDAARQQTINNLGQNEMKDPSSFSSLNFVHDNRDVLREKMSEFINSRNHNGMTAILIAITEDCSVEIIDLLLENGADPRIRNSDGRNALDLVMMLKRGVNIISAIITPARQQNMHVLGQNVMTGPSVWSSRNLVQDGRDSDMIRESMLEFINSRRHRGKSALHNAIATFDCSVETIEILLKNGADPRICDVEENTALAVAIFYKRDVNIISLIITAAREQIIHNLGQNVWPSPNLVQDGRNSDSFREAMSKFINSRNCHGNTALLNAIRKDCSVETLKILLENGADPRIHVNNGNTALGLAIFYKRGVNVISPIITAAREQIMHILGQNVITDPSVSSSPNLVPDGRDSDIIGEAMSQFINSRSLGGKTALLSAITIDCSEETVKFLLKNGADPRIRDKDGNTALAVAILCNRRVNIISLIVDAAREQIMHFLGQNVMTGPSVGSSPNLAQDGRDKNAILEAMLEFINGRNLCGRTALLISFECKFSIRTVKFLLENGADPRIPDNNGETALDLAIQNNRHRAITEIVNAVRHKPKLLFLQNGMTVPLYSVLINYLTHHRLTPDTISIIFADHMMELWKQCAKKALVWAEVTGRVDLVDSLRTICDSTGTEKPIDVSKQFPSVSKDCGKIAALI